MAHVPGKNNQGTIGSDFVVLDFLCRKDKSCIPDHCACISVFNDAICFFQKSGHCITFFCLWFFSQQFKYLLQCCCVCVGFFCMFFKSCGQFGAGCCFFHFGQSFRQVFFGPVDVF